MNDVHPVEWALALYLADALTSVAYCKLVCQLHVGLKYK